MVSIRLALLLLYAHSHSFRLILKVVFDASRDGVPPQNPSPSHFTLQVKSASTLLRGGIAVPCRSSSAWKSSASSNAPACNASSRRKALSRRRTSDSSNATRLKHPSHPLPPPPPPHLHLLQRKERRDIVRNISRIIVIIISIIITGRE